MPHVQPLPAVVAAENVLLWITNTQRLDARCVILAKDEPGPDKHAGFRQIAQDGARSLLAEVTKGGAEPDYPYGADDALEVAAGLLFAHYGRGIA